MFLECGRIVAFASAIEHMARNFEGLFLRVPVVVSPSAAASRALVLPERAWRIATWSRPPP